LRFSISDFRFPIERQKPLENSSGFLIFGHRFSGMEHGWKTPAIFHRAFRHKIILSADASHFVASRLGALRHCVKKI